MNTTDPTPETTLAAAIRTTIESDDLAGYRYYDELTTRMEVDIEILDKYIHSYVEKEEAARKAFEAGEDSVSDLLAMARSLHSLKEARHQAKHDRDEADDMAYQFL